jgi:hypothetical protein
VTIAKSIRSRGVICAPGEVFLPSMARSKEVKESDFWAPAWAGRRGGSASGFTQYERSDLLGGVGGALLIRNVAGRTAVEMIPRTRI